MRSKMNSFRQKLISFFRGYQREYLEHLYYLYRYVSLRGIASHGVFNLEQPEVFVDVNLTSANPEDLIIGVVPRGEKIPSSDKNVHHVWKYIDKTANLGNKIILVGNPGSGKTTLLKQIVLGFYKFRTRYNLSGKVPIILFLRSHVSDIVRNENIQLTELHQSSMSKGEFSYKEQWFKHKLMHGQCVILLDGMDEVGDINDRKKVAAWIEKQFDLYPKNHFIITSRPYGIVNAPIAKVQTLQILPLDGGQIEKFIYDWYLATERRLSESDDPGVRLLATDEAKDLLSRIQNTEALQPLAQNGLLLTMIATLHRFNAQLPGRRVELYNQIFEVFFRKREVLGILTAEQSKSVLMPLASYMMEKKLREVSLEEATQAIQKDLAEVSGKHIRPVEFLHSIQDQSGLLLEVAKDLYSFASLTFQEFLAATYYAERQESDRLTKEIQSDWWWETIRLYCARSDATMIIQACLAEEPPHITQLQLALNCLEEALRVKVDVRDRLETIIRQGVEDKNTQRRNVIASTLLLKRLRFMDRIDARRLIDNSLITNVEYQIFLDDDNMAGSHCPDHWVQDRFPAGKALEPVVGVRISDAHRFCKWLVPKDIWRYKFRVPEEREITAAKCETNGNQYWVFDGEAYKTSEAKRDVSPRYKEIMAQQILDDSELFASIRSAIQREKTAKPTSDLLADAIPAQHGSSSYHSSFDITGETKAMGVRDQEMKRLREWSLMQKFRRYSSRLGVNFDQFLDDIAVVDATGKGQVQNFDWMPLFPYPPEYGFDMEKEILAFVEQYPEGRLRSMLDKKFKDVISCHILVSKVLAERSWVQLTEKTDERGEVYNFIRSMARISLLVMAFASRMKQPPFSRDIANPYLMYCLLERRIAGLEKPVEGIRLVKFS